MQPKIEDNIVTHFEKEVKEKTSAEVYEQFIQITLDNYHKRTDHLQFKQQINGLLEDYPSIVALLPVFFEELEEETPVVASSRQAAPVPEAS